jgi:hypothetical protein
MVDVTLAAFITDIGTVVTLITTFISAILQLVMTNPILEIFAGAGIFAVGIKLAFRIMNRAKSLAK